MEEIDPTPDSSGSADLTADLISQFNTKPEVATPVVANPEPVKEAPKPAEAVKTPEPAKEAPKAPVAPAKTAPKVEPKEINADDPKLPAAELRKAYKELKDTHGKTIAEKQADIAKYQAKLKEFEGKRYWSDDDQKAADTAKSQLAQLQANLYAKDYSKSPEYKEKYIEPAQRIYTKALSRVKGMNVKVVDPETQETKERPATENDLLRVINAPADEKYRIAKQIFGEDAHVVTRDADLLQDLDEQSRQAVESKAKGWESEQKQAQEKTTQEATQFQTLSRQAAGSIAETYPDIFKDETDPESKAALERGMNFVRESAGKTDLPLAERASRAAIIEHWAGAFPRVLHERNKLKESVATLTAELEKLRGTDPGAGGAGGEHHKPDDDEGGSDAMAASLMGMARS